MNQTKQKILSLKKPKTLQSGIMSKNVTSFGHLLRHTYINDKDVQWAINLRSYSKSPILNNQSKQSYPPQVYFKQTQLQRIRFKNKSTKQQLKQNLLNVGQFGHLTRKSWGVKYSRQNINFHTQLGNGCNQNVKNQQGYKFSLIPKRKDEGYPKILKKNCSKLKIIGKQNQETTFDGHQNFPKYSQKILKQKNTVLWDYLAKTKVNLPNLAWHVGLRSY